MAKHWRLATTAILSTCVVAGTANAQALQRAEVLGNWTLRMTPAEGGEAKITIRSDTGRLEMPVTVSQRGQAGIACVVDGEAADCRLRRGELVVAVRMDDARMTYTLTARRGAGFTGNARLSYRLLPFGSMHLGTVVLTRR
jgi:hypothetical protein